MDRDTKIDILVKLSLFFIILAIVAIGLIVYAKLQNSDLQSGSYDEVDISQVLSKFNPYIKIDNDYKSYLEKFERDEVQASNNRLDIMSMEATTQSAESSSVYYEQKIGQTDEIVLALEYVVNSSLNLEQPSAYVQALEEERVSRDKEMRMIIVKRGDTLASLAQKVYADREKVGVILEANPKLRGVQELSVGMVLRVPSY